MTVTFLDLSSIGLGLALGGRGFSDVLRWLLIRCDMAVIFGFGDVEGGVECLWCPMGLASVLISPSDFRGNMEEITGVVLICLAFDFSDDIEEIGGVFLIGLVSGF